MNPNFALFLQILAYAGLFIGLIGSVAPVIPGPFLIWLSALLWAWADDFSRIGWPTLLALAFWPCWPRAATCSSLQPAPGGAARPGAAWPWPPWPPWSDSSSSICPARCSARPGGLLIWEARRQQGDWGQAWAAGKGVLLGYVASAILQVLIAGLMILIFLWQAFLS